MLPHQDLKADHQQEILEIVRQARAASQEENVNHLTEKDPAIVRTRLAHHVRKVANAEDRKSVV
jgi:arginine repressor